MEKRLLLLLLFLIPINCFAQKYLNTDLRYNGYKGKVKAVHSKTYNTKDTSTGDYNLISIHFNKNGFFNLIVTKTFRDGIEIPLADFADDSVRYTYTPKTPRAGRSIQTSYFIDKEKYYDTLNVKNIRLNKRSYFQKSVSTLSDPLEYSYITYIYDKKKRIKHVQSFSVNDKDTVLREEHWYKYFGEQNKTVAINKTKQPMTIERCYSTSGNVIYQTETLKADSKSNPLMVKQTYLVVGKEETHSYIIRYTYEYY